MPSRELTRTSSPCFELTTENPQAIQAKIAAEIIQAAMARKSHIGVSPYIDGGSVAPPNFSAITCLYSRSDMTIRKTKKPIIKTQLSTRRPYQSCNRTAG